MANYKLVVLASGFLCKLVVPNAELDDVVFAFLKDNLLLLVLVLQIVQNISQQVVPA